MITIPENIINEHKGYKDKVAKYLNGEIEEARFKPYRVGMGVYEQRTSGEYMVRTRIPSGVITKEQLKKVIELAEKYGNNYIHFTSRQDIQFHKITIENTVKIIEELLKVGIITKGTGGNTVRNVAVSPLSGVSIDDVFDVTPYAEATTSYLLTVPSAFSLPRKYKIAFSNSSNDTANARIADLGFIAKIHNGQKGFKVFGAGGLGGSSRTGILINDFIPDKEVLYYVKAMKILFEEKGNRTNKNKARIRYILNELGEEAFLKVYNKILKRIMEEEDLDLNIEEDKLDNNGITIDCADLRLYKQKNKGYYSVYIHPVNGNITCENLHKIITFIDKLDYGVSLRVSNTQGLFVRNLKGDAAKELINIINGFTSPYTVNHSIACAGAATCKLGLCLSQNLLEAINNRLENVSSDIKNSLPRIFISGCTNSCGQHHIGEIGLAGKAKRTKDGLIPMYTIHLGGKITEDEAHLGKVFGDLPAKKIPDFIYELGVIKSNNADISFEEFILQKEKEIKELINQLGDISTISDNSDLYYDYGSSEKFSLKGRGPGECSAGVMDVIKLDLKNAKEYLNSFTLTNNSIDLYNATLSAARTLLIIKGIDTTKDRLIFKEFSKHFIDTGYVKKEINDLLDKMLDYKLGDIEEIIDSYVDVIYLVKRVEKMYESLSPQLEITLEKENSIKNKVESNKKEEENINQKNSNEIKNSNNVIDLKGVKCPMNFVKAKIELSKINSGDVISFYLDDGAPIENVPRSIKDEGHEIISIDDNFDGFNMLTVKKK